jgi:hypothetical protein
VFTCKSTAAEEVVKRSPHTLLGVKLRVGYVATARNSPSSNVDLTAGDGEMSCAIEVKGFKKTTSQDMLQLLFENRKRSGGGTVESIIYAAEDRRAVITFEAPEGELFVSTFQCWFRYKFCRIHLCQLWSQIVY